MTLTLWTILGVALIPVVVVGLAVAWRDRRGRGGSGPRPEEAVGVNRGYTDATSAATQRKVGEHG